MSTFLDRLRRPPIVVSLDPIPDYRPGLSQSDIDLRRRISDHNARILDALKCSHLGLEARGSSILGFLPRVVLGLQRKKGKQPLDAAIEASGWIPCVHLFLREMGWRSGIIHALRFARNMYFRRPVRWITRSGKEVPQNSTRGL